MNSNSIMQIYVFIEVEVCEVELKNFLFKEGCFAICSEPLGCEQSMSCSCN